MFYQRNHACKQNKLESRKGLFQYISNELSNNITLFPRIGPLYKQNHIEGETHNDQALITMKKMQKHHQCVEAYKMIESIQLLILKMKSDSDYLEVISESVSSIKLGFKILVIQNIQKIFHELTETCANKDMFSLWGNRLRFFPALSVKVGCGADWDGGNGKNRESEWLSVHLTGLCDLFGPWFSNL